MMKKLTATIIIWIVLFPGISFSQSGDLDSSFNLDGIAMANLTSFIDEGYKVLFSPDNKIIVVAIAGIGGGQGTAVIRYNINGTIDSTFGIDGKTFIADKLAGNAVLNIDGSIVACGTHSNSTFFLFKLDSDGNINSSFGTSGFVFTDFSDLGTLPLGNSILLQSDGKIVLAATLQPWGYGPQILLTRYTETGMIDSTFGNNGRVITVFTLGGGQFASYLARDSNSGIFLLATNDGVRIVVKYNSNGIVDSSFGVDGSARIDSQYAGTTIGNCEIAVQDDGKICVAMINDQLTTYDVITARLTPNGILDNTFGNLGKAITGIRDWDMPKDIAVQSDHKILVTGSTQDNLQPPSIFLIRYDVNGALDGSFGTNGIVTTSINSQSSVANSMLVQSDGKIVVTGEVWNGSDLDVCTVRYLGSHETGIINLLLDANDVSIFPNPFPASTTITLTNYTAPFNLQLFDELGREVPLQYHTTQQGSHTMLTIDRGELPSGMYFLSVASAEKREVIKMMVD